MASCISSREKADTLLKDCNVANGTSKRVKDGHGENRQKLVLSYKGYILLGPLPPLVA